MMKVIYMSHGDLIVPVSPVVPSNDLQATRAAVAALAYARDCLKAVGADRAANKARLALSSAKGAVRHAEGKASRSQPTPWLKGEALDKATNPNGGR